MKKFLKAICITMIAIIILTGCSKPDVEALIKENEELRLKIEALDQLNKENQELKEELKTLKYSPEVLLAHIDLNYENMEYNKALDTIYLLLENHPSSPEAQKAIQIKNEIAEISAKLKDKRTYTYDTKTLKEASVSVKEKLDEETNIIWYIDKSTSHRVDTNAFYAYFSEKDKNLPWLRMRVQYTGVHLLMINKFIINADDKTLEISPEMFSVKRNEKGGLAWEWYDTSVDNTSYDILKSIVEADNVNLICEGEKGNSYRTISVQEKKALKNILVMYETSGGILSNSAKSLK